MNLQAAPKSNTSRSPASTTRKKQKLAGGFVSKFIKHLEEIEKMTICPIAKKVFFNERKVRSLQKRQALHDFLSTLQQQKRGAKPGRVN